MIANIGDYVRFEGLLYKEFFQFEKDFINKNLEIGKFYKVLSIDTNWAGTGETSYKIAVNETTYMIPIICFTSNIKEMYGLR